MADTLPTSVLAVEAWLCEMMSPAVAAQLETPYPFLFGMATAKLAEAHREVERLTALDAPALLDALKECRELLDDYSDVTDGEDGPRPNRAMSMLQTIEAVIWKAEAVR